MIDEAYLNDGPDTETDADSSPKETDAERADREHKESADNCIKDGLDAGRAIAEGHTPEKAMEAGYSMEQLHSDAHMDVHSLESHFGMERVVKELGFDKVRGEVGLKELSEKIGVEKIKEHCTVSEMYHEGVPVKDMYDHGVTIKDLHEAKVPAKDLYDIGVHASEMRGGGYSLVESTTGYVQHVVDQYVHPSKNEAPVSPMLSREALSKIASDAYKSSPVSCNVSTSYVAEKGFNNTALNGKLANDQVEFMNENWKEITARKAQQIANEGGLAVAGLEDKGKDENGNDKHGHTMTVSPGEGVEKGEDFYPNVSGGGKGAGASDGRKTVNETWNKIDRQKVRYFTPKK